MLILYEDNHLIAGDKPAGMATQGERSFETKLKMFIKERDKKKGNVFLHALHRLDQPVSGIVLFAKTEKALSRMNRIFREERCHKEYIALVQGKRPHPIRFTDHLIHGHKKAIIVSHTHPKAKQAMLEILSVEQKSPKLWKLLIHLLTGRYHQIRAQLAAHQLPILGDRKYGSSHPFIRGRIALHHSTLIVDHPITQKPIRIESALPF